MACATRGEAGDPAPGSVSRAANSLTSAKASCCDAVRLGARRVIVLDWLDSGMDGEPAPDTLAAAPLEDVAERIVGLLDELRPTIVVTLDGSDGHRDHLHVRDATLLAVEQAIWQVSRVYLHCLPQRLMRQWVAALEAQQPDAAHLALGESAPPRTRSRPWSTPLPSARSATTRWRSTPRRRRRTPVMPPALRDAFLNSDSLRRIRPPWPGGAREQTIFAGRSD